MDGIEPLTFKRFSEISTMHGLYRIGHSDGLLRRVAWGIVVTALFASVIALTTMTLKEHFSHVYFTEMEKVTEGSMIFPSVTICHANNFKLSAFRSKADNLTELMKRLIDSTITHSLNVGEIIPPTGSEVAKEFAKAYINSTVIRQLSATPDALYWNFEDWCKFSLRSACNYSRDFHDYFFSSTSGFCKTFNLNKTYIQIAPGYAFALNMKLYIDEWDKLPLLNDNGAGVIVMIHPQDIYPNPYTEGILLPLGFESQISIRKLAFSRLKSPYKSNCTDGKGAFLIYPGRYTVQNCQYSCILKYLLETCGYHESAYEYHRPKEYAKSLKISREKNYSTTEMYGCIRTVFSEGTASKIQGCSCQPACFEEKILTKTTYAQWPHPSAAEYYRKLVSNFTNRKDMTKEQLYQSLVSLRVFFDELGYDSIREKPRSTFTSLLSQIGGQFGLWIGASIFSVTEILIFIFNTVIFAWKRKVDPEKERETTATVFTEVDNSININRFAWEREVRN